MALAHTLGFPRIGADGEPKNALEAYCNGDSNQAALHSVGHPLRARHYCLASEFSLDQPFELNWEPLFEETAQALAQGHKVKPVILGPLSYLWQGKAKGNEFNTLDLLENLLPVYAQTLSSLAEQGVEWVQIDEPILSLDLPQEWKSAFERAYHILQYSPLKKLVATYFSGLEGNLGLAVGLPVDGLHVDLVRAPDPLHAILDRLPTYKVLSLGLVNGRNVSRCDLENALTQLQEARERLGDNLWVAGSCSLLH
ncbi:hypothetical protein KO536_01350 [Pseudomonas sp. NKUCC02_KPG]|jgi:5-methyltetrahydropteroyltriglutamate--homocysteine methyltransferase|nr:hypothetical protein [Pseudomonas sp. NKUCC02_KPG]